MAATQSILERRPFLYVISKDQPAQRYYLEVWNEPGFKIQREE